MTSNTNAPFGFKQVDATSGVSPNYGITRGLMAYNASAVYRGDPLILSSGLVAVATVTGGSGAAVVGVADYFKWVSIAQNRTVIQNFYPGNDSQGNANVEVGYINLGGALFDVQTNAVNIGQANVGQFINFATGTGNQYTGQSGFTVDQGTLNSTQGTLPFVVAAIEPGPFGGNLAYDPTGTYNIIRVGFATQTKL